MQDNRKNSNDMESQTRLKQEEIINRCYVSWNHKKRGSYEEEPMIMLFRHSHKRIPFQKQTPTEILTEKQLEKRYGVKIRWEEPKERS